MKTVPGSHGEQGALGTSPVFRLHDALTRYSAGLAEFLAAAVAALYCTDVLARYLFNAPLFGVSAISGYLLCATVCLAVPVVTKEGAHVTILFIQDRLSPAAARRYGRLIAHLSALACLIVAIVTALETERQFANEILTESEILFPKWTVSIFIPYGFLSMALYFFRIGLGERGHD